MLFNLEADTGDTIRLYVVPDTYSAIPSIVVSENNVELLTVEANEVREALVAARRHETGRCGFYLDSHLVPNIAEIKELSIYERETGLLVYRRRREADVTKKVVRIETNFLPMFHLDKILSSNFQHGVRSIEKFGLETSTQLFLLGSVDSVYLSGRILYRNYSFYIDGNFAPIICLDDPYMALAERLLILSKLGGERAHQILGDRDAHLLKQAIAYSAQLKFDDGKSLRRALRNLPPEVAVALVNPLTRQLTCSTPDEMPRRGAIASAFDVLASFAVVGLKDDRSTFNDTLSAVLGLRVEEVRATPPLAGVVALGNLLKADAQVEGLVEEDLEVYARVREAHLAGTGVMQGVE